MNRRLALAAAASLAVAAVAPVAAWAQAFPAKPIRLVVPFPPGGGTDILGRMIAQRLGESYGQTVIAENRPGAGGNVGAEFTARQPPDGYTIVLCSPSISISPSLYRKLNYDPLKDLAPIGLVASIPNLLVVHPSVPARSVQELIALARKNPGKLNFGSGGAGTTNDLGARYFIAENKLKIEMIPHKGANQAQTALISGEVDMLVIGTAAAAPFVKSGKLRALAVTSGRRAAVLPEVPTIAEATPYRGYEANRFGLFAPAGTPPAILERLTADTRKVLAMPETRDALALQGLEPASMTPAQFAAMIRVEIERWRKAASVARATP